MSATRTTIATKEDEEASATTVADENSNQTQQKSLPDQVGEWLAAQGPVGLYALAWSWVKSYIAKPDRLADWSSWEHRFDDRIHSFEDAARFAEMMVKSTGDHIAEVFYGPGLAYDRALEEGIFLGTGMVFGPDRDKNHLVIKDSHGNLLPEFDERDFPVVTWVIEGSPAHLAGIKAGDSLSAINRLSARGKSIHWLTDLINGSEDASLTVRRWRCGKARSVRLTQTATALNGHHKRIGNVGYIRIESFFDRNIDAQVAAALEELADCAGYVIDVRGTPGGRTNKTAQVLSLFLDEGTVARYESTGDGRVELVLTKSQIDRIRPDEPDKSTVVERRPNLSHNKPLVILISRNTRSAPEVFTIALKENGRATVVGEPSFGKGIVGMCPDMGPNARLEIPIGRWYSPFGRWLGDAAQTCHFGVYPDVGVKANPGIIFGGANDNQLETALALIEARS